MISKLHVYIVTSKWLWEGGNNENWLVAIKQKYNSWCKWMRWHKTFTAKVLLGSEEQLGAQETGISRGQGSMFSSYKTSMFSCVSSHLDTVFSFCFFVLISFSVNKTRIQGCVSHCALSK